MRDGLRGTIAASLLGIVGACTSDPYAPYYYYDAYVYPVVDYGYVDSALWYDGYYNPYIGYAALTASPPSVDPAGSAFDGGAQSSLPRPLIGLLAMWRAVLRPDCVPDVEVVDYDGDGVPASYNATFACVDIKVGDRTSSVTGTIAIADADDATKLSAYTVTFTDFSVTTSVAGNVRARTLNGTATWTPTDAGAFQSVTSITVAFDLTDAGRSPIQGTYSAMGLATYTPDASPEGDVFASGTASLSGTGTLTRMFDGVSQSRSITRQTNPPLHWNRGCRTQNADSPGFDFGTLVYQDDKGDKIELQFNGCGSANVTTNR